MANLALRRPVFHSEIDFQLALSATMVQDDAERVRLECRQALQRGRVRGKKHIEIDIMAEVGGHSVALELKYPKRAFVGTVVTDGQPEEFDLPAGGAPDVDASAIWHDSERIETLLRDNVVAAGAAITLSNFPFWNSTTLREGTQAHAFRLWEGREVEAGSRLEWQGAGWTTSGPVNLASRYICRWHDYSRPDGKPSGTEFRYLCLEPDYSLLFGR